MIVNCTRAIVGTICILMSLTDERDGASARLDFDSLIEQHYRSLYQFAFSLTQSESDAWDLTQQTFYIWATKGHQLRDVSKVKTWLFTTLHRSFLVGRRRDSKFAPTEWEEAAEELPAAAPGSADLGDSSQVRLALGRVEEVYRAAVALFYLQDLS